MTFARTQLKLPILCLLLFILSACSSRHIVTVWKQEHAYSTLFKQIMVAAILPQEDSLIRKHAESEFTANLKDAGYPAISAFEYFENPGSARMDQEGTYIKLCESGIDYVLIVALVPATKNKYREDSRSLFYTDAYYYNRIWEYKTKLDDTKNNTGPCVYESILFDLSTLQAICVFRSQTFDISERAKRIDEFSKQLLKKMIRKKVLPAETKSPDLKPF